MIFITTGGQTPFDRLVRTVDAWAATGAGDEVFAQVGDGTYRPKCLDWTRYLSPGEFQERVRAARLVVAHAGTGTLMSALEHGKPILILPRRAALGETRNEHQLATARRFEGHPGVFVAYSEADLPGLLTEIVTGPAIEARPARPSDRLILEIRSFVESAGRAPARGGVLRRFRRRALAR